MTSASFIESKRLGSERRHAATPLRRRAGCRGLGPRDSLMNDEHYCRLPRLGSFSSRRRCSPPATSCVLLTSRSNLVNTADLDFAALSADVVILLYVDHRNCFK